MLPQGTFWGDCHIGLSWSVATWDFLGFGWPLAGEVRWGDWMKRMRVRRQEERHHQSSGWTATDSAPTTVGLRVSVPRTSRDRKHPTSYLRWARDGEWCIIIGWLTNDNAEGCSIDTIARQSADISPGTNLQKRDRESHPHYYRQRLESNGPEKQGVTCCTFSLFFPHKPHFVAFTKSAVPHYFAFLPHLNGALDYNMPNDTQW